jgi:hypothetical protein
MLRLLSNMLRDVSRFNLFFRLTLVAALAAGCETTGSGATDAKKDEKKKDKEYALLRIYREASNKEGSNVGKVQFPRNNSLEFYVEKDSVVDETFIKQARLINTVGDEFVIGVEYNERGALRLQMESGIVLGRHLLIQGVWPKYRWLSAPLISRAIDNGVLLFTPDCNREEAEKIVRGLNNVAVKVGNQEKPKKSKPEVEPKKTGIEPGQDIGDPFSK